ncbi:glycosyltransferase family 4 protein [Crassaminicella thermophila]|uniref:Glycosyltransferase family 4 protein n=1 Tax=Crassaminicella thermophila TaxID=2599308 RepID=A0A5C0SGL0_CRATE|nr:glycosyltransferase [Crassaminicella thermophila]QEK13451.1 glycosyltransferase family 4 protein [Crassaminicella thermophila]
MLKHKIIYKNAPYTPVAFKEKKQLHIAMFTNNYLPFIGGVPLSIHRLAEGLRELGHRVYIFAPEYPMYKNHDHEDIIRCKLLKYLKTDKFNFAISDIFSSHIEETFKNLPIDIVHVHHPYWMGEKGMSLAKKYKIPIVFTYHTRFERCVHMIPYIGKKIGEWLPNHMVKQFSSDCDGVFAPTLSAKEHLQSLAIKTPIEILPTGIDLNQYKVTYKETEQIRRKYLKEEHILLFCASRLSKEKNLFFLLEGLKHVKNHTSVKFKCIIAGDGPEKQNIKNYIFKHKLNDIVYLLGEIPPTEINKYYMASDIFVFSSTAETQGLVILEAMAASLPVVAVSSFGIRDIIKDGVNGYITKEKIEDWANQLIVLLENPRKLKQMSIEAFKTATKYTIDTMAKKAVQVYKHLLENPLF